MKREVRMKVTKRQAGYPLKVWGDEAWNRKLSNTLTVSRVDEDIPTDQQTNKRKPWSIVVMRTGEDVTLRDWEPKPPNQRVVLSEDEVLALVEYLLEPQTALYCEQPAPTEPGIYKVQMFEEPGMVAVSESGELVNGEAHWSPIYFREAVSTDTPRTLKIHTLPWRMPKHLVRLAQVEVEVPEHLLEACRRKQTTKRKGKAIVERCGQHPVQEVGTY